MGRPKKENSKEKTIKVRIDSETDDKLYCIMLSTGLSISEILRQGIDAQYRSVRKSQF